jgi:hypothetical protein
MPAQDSTASEPSDFAKPTASKASTIVLGLFTLPALAAALCGATALLAALFPGNSGEWAGLPVMIASCVAVPIGIVGLVVAGWLARTPSSLRRFVLIASAIALALSFAGWLVLRIHR